MSECMNDGCENERIDARGSLGRFCSVKCRDNYNATPHVDAEAIANAIARGESNE